MMKQLEENVIKMNSEGVAKIRMTMHNLIIAFVTPLMLRVHTKLKHSGEMVFIDASGTMDHHNCRVFLLLTHSSAGGLPLGCFITTSESREVIELALNLYNDLLDDACYFGRGKSGPCVIMTDDSAAERLALAAVYPNSTILLCIFHILQALWRFLWDAKNGVKKEDRPAIFSQMKAMVYAESEAQLEELYAAAVGNHLVARYKNGK
jgi:hypothetical protein